ncbi:MAG TPA: hypothetical protein VGP93_14990, partial [Polyangiaceae bacterium]|nr:hypothetical protein [Polyangiaceae bacterium]
MGRALLALALFASGCSHPETTSVARGEYFAAGQPDFDDFFVRVYRFQRDTAAALQTETDAHAELARALG